MKMSLLVLFLGMTMLGAGCLKESTPLIKPNVASTTSQVEQIIFSSKLFPELTLAYLSDYQVEDGTVSRWVAVKKNDIARIEIFRMKDFGDRPFGFEDATATQKEIDGYVPKQQLTKLGFDIWVYYEKDDEKTKDELMRIIGSMSVK